MVHLSPYTTHTEDYRCSCDRGYQHASHSHQVVYMGSSQHRNQICQEYQVWREYLEGSQWQYILFCSICRTTVRLCRKILFLLLPEMICLLHYSSKKIVVVCTSYYFFYQIKTSLTEGIFLYTSKYDTARYRLAT